MDKVKGNVPGSQLRLVVADQALPELREHCTRRRLGLHEPAMVETEVALSELQGAPVLRVQLLQRGQQLGEVVHDISQGEVVVRDLVAGSITVVRRVLRLHLGQQYLQFHDVVDGREGEESDHAFLVHLVATPPLVDQEPRVDEQLLKVVPVTVAIEVEPLVRLEELLLRVSAGLDRLPLFVNAKAEAVLPIGCYPHHPIDGEESSHCALVLVTNGTARVDRRHLQVGGVRTVLLEEIKVQLRESMQVLVELHQAVLRVRDAPRHLPNRGPIGLRAVQRIPERCTWWPIGPVMHAALHAEDSLRREQRQRHTLDEPQLNLVRDWGRDSRRHRRWRCGCVLSPVSLSTRGRGAHRCCWACCGSVGSPRPDVQLRADGQTVLVMLGVEVEIPFCGGKLLTLWQSDVGGVFWVHDPDGDLVDAIERAQAWVTVADHIVLRVVTV
mmetsp:Transcript_16248/g.44742  ORF Transcript_16248/g.44742 Transcript_16248/m.44742 type:complete len:441 (-) Transcript_16248:614-1936(-)